MSGHTHEGEVLIGTNSYFYVYHPKPLWIVHVHVSVKQETKYAYLL